MQPIAQMPQPGGSPMNPQQLIEQMHDIIAPPAVGWWPPAPGWWVLAVLLLALLIWGIVSWRRHYLRGLYRRQALALLNRLDSCSDDLLPTEVNRLLKRTALSAYPAQSTAINQAFGEAWVLWLNHCFSQSVFEGDAALAIAYGGYQPDLACPRAQLLESARRWIEKHKRNANPGGAHV